MIWKSLPRAFHFEERVAFCSEAFLRQNGGAARLDAANAKLEWWSQELLYVRGQILGWRAAEFDIDTQKVIQLIGLSDEDLAAIAPPSMPWWSDLAEICELLSKGPDEKAWNLVGGAKVISLSWPWLAWAVAQLKAQLEDLRGAIEGVIDLESAVDLFLPALRQRFIEIMTRTFSLEINIARLKGELKGTTEKERFDEFCMQLGHPARAIPLLEEYPVLARLLTEEADRWARNAGEFVRRLVQDLPELKAKLFAHDHAGKVARINLGQGDYHNGGKCVCIVEFENNSKVVYKPRSLKGDVLFHDLLEGLSANSSWLPFKRPKIVDRGEYGWYEFIESAECRRRGDIDRFYYRAGQVLAVAYMLYGTDLHYENLIAHGEHPIPVDLECLFATGFMQNSPSEKRALECDYRETLLDIGLLPGPKIGRDGPELSGLGLPFAACSSAFPVLSWERFETDSAQLVRKKITLNDRKQANLPTMGPSKFSPHLFAEDIAAGFANGCAAIVDRQEDLLSGTLWEEFCSQRYRIVSRPTMRYFHILQDSFHPNLLRDAMDRDAIFDLLWSAQAADKSIGRLIRSERRDLWAGDIPFFTRRPTESSIRDSRGAVQFQSLEPAPKVQVETRIRQFRNTDIARHAWAIRTAYDAVAFDEPVHRLLRPKPWTPANGGSNNHSPDELGLVSEIAHRLESLAYARDANPFWVDVIDGSDRHSSNFHPGIYGIDLYAGLSGYLLFFHACDRFLETDRRSDLVERLETMIAQAVSRAPESATEVLGGFGGLSSILYVLSLTTNEKARSKLVTAAFDRLMELIVSNISKDKSHDLINGAAGALCALLTHYSVTKSARALELACLCGDQLQATATPQSAGVAWITIPDNPPLGGFAHGTAGIAYSLIRLHRFTGREEYATTARKAIEYDRSTYSSVLGNWRDLRKWSESEDSVAWCHGAAGVGLSRCAMLRLGFQDDLFPHEIKQAAHKVLSTRWHSHNLCHGAFGNLEFLMAADAAIESDLLRQSTQRYRQLLLDELRANGLRSDSKAETLNMMLGWAGVGYSLLRMAYPAVPSVLLLEP